MLSLSQDIINKIPIHEITQLTLQNKEAINLEIDCPINNQYSVVNKFFGVPYANLKNKVPTYKGVDMALLLQYRFDTLDKVYDEDGIYIRLNEGVPKQGLLQFFVINNEIGELEHKIIYTSDPKINLNIYAHRFKFSKDHHEKLSFFLTSDFILEDILNGYYIKEFVHMAKYIDSDKINTKYISIDGKVYMTEYIKLVIQKFLRPELIKYYSIPTFFGDGFNLINYDDNFNLDFDREDYVTLASICNILPYTGSRYLRQAVFLIHKDDLAVLNFDNTKVITSVVDVTKDNVLQIDPFYASRYQIQEKSDLAFGERLKDVIRAYETVPKRTFPES